MPLGPGDGLPVECAASFDNLRVVPKTFLVERITRLDPPRMSAACLAARRAIDCD